jgi:hypothetical protein
LGYRFWVLVREISNPTPNTQHLFARADKNSRDNVFTW